MPARAALTGEHRLAVSEFDVLIHRMLVALTSQWREIDHLKIYTENIYLQMRSFCTSISSSVNAIIQIRSNHTEFGKKKQVYWVQMLQDDFPVPQMRQEQKTRNLTFVP